MAFQIPKLDSRCHPNPNKYQKELDQFFSFFKNCISCRDPHPQRYLTIVLLESIHNSQKNIRSRLGGLVRVKRKKAIQNSKSILAHSLHWCGNEDIDCALTWTNIRVHLPSLLMMCDGQLSVAATSLLQGGARAWIGRSARWQGRKRGAPSTVGRRWYKRQRKRREKGDGSEYVTYKPYVTGRHQ